MKKLIYFLFIFSNLCFGQKQNYEDRKALADSLYNNNEYEHSLQIFDELLEKDSKNHYLLGRVGLCLYDLKNYQKAKEKFRLAALYCPVDENKTIAGYYANLSSCYSNLKENEKAYQYASKAYSLDNKSSEILWNAALNALNLGKYDECLNILDNAKIEKSNAFFSLYGQSYLGKGESKKAIENYENLLENYDEKNDVFKVDLQYQKGNLFNAYMNILDSKESSDNLNKYKNRLGELFSEISQDQRNMILNNLLDRSMVCYKNKFITELFKNKFEELTTPQKIQVYYLDNEFQKCFELVNNFLKPDLISDEKILNRIQSCRYLAFLNLLIEDMITHNGRVNKEKLETTITLYNNLFKKNKIYNDDEFENQDGLLNTLATTIDTFNERFPKAEQNRIAPVLFEIIDNTPNEKYRKQYQKIKYKISTIIYQ